MARIDSMRPLATSAANSSAAWACSASGAMVFWPEVMIKRPTSRPVVTVPTAAPVYRTYLHNMDAVRRGEYPAFWLVTEKLGGILP